MPAQEGEMRRVGFGLCLVAMSGSLLFTACQPFTGEADPDLSVSNDAVQPGDVAATRLFSVALITDIHIGEGHLDYGSAGHEDQGGDEDQITARIREAVKRINAGAKAHDIQFTMVLGDLTDSGERSEYVKGRSILDSLAMPYFPILGNHDVWPYSRKAGGTWVQADKPVGDRVFQETFSATFKQLAGKFPGLTRAPAPTLNPQHSLSSHFQNYAFDFKGFHFIGLDFVTRARALQGYPGVDGEADLHDFDGGTWRWFKDHLKGCANKGYQKTIVLSHHPLFAAPLFGFSDAEYKTISAHLVDQGHGKDIFAFFAGHLHLNMLRAMGKSTHVVVTTATKTDTTIRLLEFYSDGTVDFSSFLK